MNPLPPDDTTPASRAWEDWIDHLKPGDPAMLDGKACVVEAIDDEKITVRRAGTVFVVYEFELDEPEKNNG